MGAEDGGKLVFKLKLLKKKNLVDSLKYTQFNNVFMTIVTEKEFDDDGNSSGRSGSQQEICHPFRKKCIYRDVYSEKLLHTVHDPYMMIRNKGHWTEHSNWVS